MVCENTVLILRSNELSFLPDVFVYNVIVHLTQQIYEKNVHFQNSSKKKNKKAVNKNQLKSRAAVLAFTILCPVSSDKEPLFGYSLMMFSTICIVLTLGTLHLN